MIIGFFGSIFISVVQNYQNVIYDIWILDIFSGLQYPLYIIYIAPLFGINLLLDYTPAMYSLSLAMLFLICFIISVYIKKNNGYTVYTAISKTRENIDKINKLYDNKYIIQKVNVPNDEFIQNLDEYEKLLTLANDKETIMVIENQILSCYEKMVVNNE